MLGQMHSFFSFFLSRRRRRRLQQQGKHGGRWSARVRLCPFIQERWHTRTMIGQREHKKKERDVNLRHTYKKK